MTGPEQHAATVRDAIERAYKRGKALHPNAPADAYDAERTESLAALDALEALADERLAAMGLNEKWWQARADELQRERDAYRRANESVRVCSAHTSEITDGDDCLVCSLEDANGDAGQARREADALRSAQRLWREQDQELRAALEEIAGTDFDEPSDFSELGRIARAALAGVQADWRKPVEEADRRLVEGMLKHTRPVQADTRRPPYGSTNQSFMGSENTTGVQAEEKTP